MNIRMIAKLAGCSTAAVSAVLSGKTGNIRVSPQTREDIKKICSDVGYEPNIQATRLFARQTRVIGFLTPFGFLDDPNLSRFSTALYAECSAQDYRLLLLVYDTTFVDERKYLSLYRQREIDALVIWGVYGDTKWLQELGGTEYPVILGANRAGNLPSVTCDEEYGIGTMVNLCRERGAKSFMHISGNDTDQSQRRMAGFMTATEGCRTWIVPGDGGLASGTNAIPAIRECRPDAVICFNDKTAIGLLQGARQNGLRVPEDFMVTGADDIEMAGFIDPPLTTYDQMSIECGRICAEQLLGHLQQGSFIMPQSIIPSIRERGTVGCPVRK